MLYQHYICFVHILNMLDLLIKLTTKIQCYIILVVYCISSEMTLNYYWVLPHFTGYMSLDVLPRLRGLPIEVVEGRGAGCVMRGYN